MTWLLQYGIALLVFFAIDLVWLAVIAQKLYAKYLGYLLAKQVNWAAAIIFYLIFIGGLMFFVISPSLLDLNVQQLLIRAALYGFITYATYDLTNLATIRDWPITITLIDLVWGTFLSTSVSVVSFYVITTFLG
jgi:uncharacterized membrane protein